MSKSHFFTISDVNALMGYIYIYIFFFFLDVLSKKMGVCYLLIW